jgi:hypothetical protein
MSQCGKVVPANPLVPRALGVVHLIYAAVGVLASLIFGVYFVLFPAMLGYASEQWPKGAAGRTARATQQLDEVDQKLAEATDPLQIEDLTERKLELEVTIEYPEHGSEFFTFGMSSPKVAGVLGTQLFTGVFLFFLMAVAAIGLLVLKPWGQWMAVAVAWMMLVQLVASNLLIALVSAPTIAEGVREQVTRFQEAQANRPAPEPEEGSDEIDAGPTLGPEELATSLQGLIVTHCIGSPIFGGLYPGLTIWLLGLPKTRAAFMRKAH